MKCNPLHRTLGSGMLVKRLDLLICSIMNKHQEYKISVCFVEFILVMQLTSYYVGKKNGFNVDTVTDVETSVP